MSSLAYHAQHFKSGSVGAVGKHNWEKRGKEDTHSNQDIDPSRSHLNFQPQPLEGSLYMAAKRRIQEGCTGRVTANSNWITETIVYPPEDVIERYKETQDDTELRQYFADVLQWHHGEFGAANVLAATAHLDETTPHLHTDVVPLTEEGKLSSKEVFARKNLRRHHTELAKFLSERGWDITRGESTLGKQVVSKTVSEYKKDAEAAKVEIKKEIDGLQKEVDTLTTKTQEAREGLEAVKEETEGLRAEKTALKAVVEPLRAVQPDVEACEIEVTPVMLRPGEVRVKKTELESVVEQAKAFVVQAEQLQERSGELDQRERALEERRAFLAGRELRTQDDWKNLDRERKQLETEKKEFQTAWATLNRRATAVVERERVVGELEAKNQTVHEELNKAQTKIRELSAENTTLRQENSSLKEKITALKNAVVGVYKSLSAVVKAVCMLKYSNTEYRVEGLTRKQGRLIDAIADYGARWAEKAGFKEMAADMSQNVGISEGIQQSIAEREKMEKKKQQQRDEDR